MKNLAFIPARGGSKRLPRKNLIPVNGIPLIVYTIRAAKASGLFKRIVVSSDDKDIIGLSLEEGVDVDCREPEFAGDRVTVVQALTHYLDKENAWGHYDTVAALYPTAPLRDAQDIVNAYALFVDTAQSRSLVSVSEYDFPPQFSMTWNNGEETVTMVNPDNYLKTQSQSHSRMYHPNGAIFIAGMAFFRCAGTFYGNPMKAYVMPPEKSIDIDYEYQLKLAEYLLKDRSQP